MVGASRNPAGGRRGRSPRRREVHPRAPSPPGPAIREKESPRAAAAAPRQRIESTPETPSRCAQQPGDRAETPLVAAARPGGPRSIPGSSRIRDSPNEKRNRRPRSPPPRRASRPRGGGDQGQRGPSRCAQQPGDRAETPLVAAARPGGPRSIPGSSHPGSPNAKRNRRQRSPPPRRASRPRRGSDLGQRGPSRCAQQPGDRAETPLVAAGRPGGPRSIPGSSRIRDSPNAKRNRRQRSPPQPAAEACARVGVAKRSTAAGQCLASPVVATRRPPG